MAREIHHHRQLRHPNIVALYEVLSTESAIFIVSEYCPNGELFDLLTETGRFTEQQAQRYFRQLVDAIHYCHERNIVHRYTFNHTSLLLFLLTFTKGSQIGEYLAGYGSQCKDLRLWIRSSCRR